MRSTLNLHGFIFCISPEPDLKVKLSYKSEAPPLAVSPPGKVRDVVYKTLHAQGAAGADEAVLLLFYKPLQHGLDEVLIYIYILSL